jgi:hypothetical protein
MLPDPKFPRRGPDPAGVCCGLAMLLLGSLIVIVLLEALMFSRPSDPRNSGVYLDSDPGPGDDVPCVKCGAKELDTGLECANCGHDNYEAVVGHPFPGTKGPGS